MSVGKMWADSQPLQLKFAEAGLTDYVDRLKALVTKTHQAVDEQTVSKGARVEAAQAIKQSRRSARITLLRLDAMMRHLLRDDLPILAVWERSRRIDRPPLAKSADVTAGQAVNPASPPELAASATA